MKRTLAAVALTALFASSAAAEDIELYKEITNNAGETVPLRYCYDSEGIAVRLRMSSHPNPMDPNYWGAFSSFVPINGPLIDFKPEMLDFSAEVIRFAWEHECGHHALGHVRELFNNYAFNIPQDHKNIMSYELAADCYATRQLAEAGALDEDVLSRIMAAFPANDHSTTHPPTSFRLEHALQCLAP